MKILSNDFLGGAGLSFTARKILHCIQTLVSMKYYCNISILNKKSDIPEWCYLSSDTIRQYPHIYSRYMYVYKFVNYTMAKLLKELEAFT